MYKVHMCLVLLMHNNNIVSLSKYFGITHVRISTKFESNDYGTF